MSRMRVCFEEVGEEKIEITVPQVQEVDLGKNEIAEKAEDIVNIAENIEIALNDVDVLNQLEGIPNPNPSMESLVILRITVSDIKRRLGYKDTSFACESNTVSVAIESLTGDIWKRIKAAFKFIFEKIKEFFNFLMSFKKPILTAAQESLKTISEIATAAANKISEVISKEGIYTYSNNFGSDGSIKLTPHVAASLNFLSEDYYKVTSRGLERSEQEIEQFFKFFETRLHAQLEAIRTHVKTVETELEHFISSKKFDRKSLSLTDVAAPKIDFSDVDIPFGLYYNEKEKTLTQSQAIIGEDDVGVDCNNVNELVAFAKQTVTFTEHYNAFVEVQGKTFTYFDHDLAAAIERFEHLLKRIDIGIANPEKMSDDEIVNSMAQDFFKRHIRYLSSVRSFVMMTSVKPTQMYNMYVQERIRLQNKLKNKY